MSMVQPHVTALYVALLGLLGAALTILVILGRTKYKVTAGDGGQAGLTQAIRAHANFAEQAPLGLLLIGFAEALGTSRAIVHGLGIVLLVARLASAIALSGSLNDTVLRRIGASLTIAVYLVGSVLLLLQLAGIL